MDQAEPTAAEARWGPSAFVSPAEAAHHLRRSRAWIYLRIKEGQIRARRVAGVLRIPREEWERWLHAHVESATTTEAIADELMGGPDR